MKVKYIVTGVICGAVMLCADQWSKSVARGMTPTPQDGVEITSFFNIVHVWNYGVSFGLFQSGSMNAAYVLIAVASAITLLFAVFLARAQSLWVGVASGIVIGGAIGNIIDRFQFGAVYDFLDFHFAGYHYPAFNIADSCVVIGIAMIVIDGLFWPEQNKLMDE